MNKIYKFLFLVIIFLNSCSIKNQIDLKPNIEQIRSICELATLECYYHNVAKSIKPKSTLFQNERKFWVQYNGIVKIGIDMSKINMTVKNNTINIVIPKAKILSISTITPNLDDFLSDNNEGGFIIGIGRNQITAEDQTTAIATAQEQIYKDIENNNNLLTHALDRGKTLISEYINNIGELTNRKYEVIFTEVSE